MTRRLPLLAVAALLGCGGGGGGGDHPPRPLPRSAPSLGPTRHHRPPSLGARAARGATIGGLRCAPVNRPRQGVHLELFAGRRVVLIPAGIGIAPPRARRGAAVEGGRCSYPIRTREPTGVLEVDTGGRTKTLGQLFAIWGQPLSPTRMAGFNGRPRAYVNGRRRQHDPRAIPLRRHAQIVLEVGGYVPPHRTYLFPPGL